MSGIAGVDRPGMQETVKKMLKKISYRGRAGSKVRSVKSATLGMVCTKAQVGTLERMVNKNEAVDVSGSEHLALAKAKEEGVFLKRDHLGVAPLYYGEDDKGITYFASEVKALLDFCSEVVLFPPGHKSYREKSKPYFKLKKKESIKKSPALIAEELRGRIEKSISKRIKNREEFGAWLSGGLDSSTLAALARPYSKKLLTFAAGFDGSPDLEYAREVADYIDSEHHEVVVQFKDLLSVLPEVIYHLESFDTLLVRSTLVNYIVAQKASEYVNSVLSGEGGDELFAGYHYLKNLDLDELPDELIDITRRMHNTALQRVDRCAAAHGTVAHICFLDPEVVDYALRIPPEYKLNGSVEKWILRVALDGMLPEKVLKRKKAKFWKGAGVKGLISEHAENTITDNDFRHERVIKKSWKLRSKEELLYYRTFRQYFGNLEDFSWMGRTKMIPA